jgi:hypothetical protein
MSKYQGHIDCARKAITVTSSDGVQIEHVATMPSSKAHYKKSISGPTLDQVLVVCEYPDVFPEELPGMPHDRDIEFIICHGNLETVAMGWLNKGARRW